MFSLYPNYNKSSLEFFNENSLFWLSRNLPFTIRSVLMNISLVVDPSKCRDACTDRNDDPLHMPRYLNKFSAESTLFYLLLPSRDLGLEFILLLKRSKTAVFVSSHHVIQILFVVIEVQVVAPYLQESHKRDNAHQGRQNRLLHFLIDDRLARKATEV